MGRKDSVAVQNPGSKKHHLFPPACSERQSHPGHSAGARSTHGHVKIISNYCAKSLTKFWNGLFTLELRGKIENVSDEAETWARPAEDHNRKLAALSCV